MAASEKDCRGSIRPVAREVFKVRTFLAFFCFMASPTKFKKQKNGAMTCLTSQQQMKALLEATMTAVA
jgi:hypothetical protein